jgi:hypothetical protein
VTAGDRFAAKVRAYQSAFDGVDPVPRLVRLLVFLGLARRAHWFIHEKTWLAVVLADFERHCGARADQAIFVDDDPAGRISAYNEGHRQAFLHLSRLLRIPPEQLAVEADRLDREESEALLRLEQRRSDG